MSYNKTKCDPELGKLVHEHLVKCGVETPTFQHAVDRKDKIEMIEKDFWAKNFDLYQMKMNVKSTEI